MLLHSGFDVIVLVPYTHLNAVSGVVTFTAMWRMITPRQNNHNNINNSSSTLNDSSLGLSASQKGSQMHISTPVKTHTHTSKHFLTVFSVTYGEQFLPGFK